MSADFPFPALTGLEPSDLQALEAAGARQYLRRGEAFCSREGETIVLFPVGGLVRVGVGLADGDGVLAALVGPGGAVGLSEALTGGGGEFSAVALTDVAGWAIDAGRLRRLATERPGVAMALAGVLAGMLEMAGEELACAVHHRIEQRLARLLLRLKDRLGAVTLDVTQDELAQMLAVQRTSVTTLAHRLKLAGLLSYGRGRIRILDTDRLKALACGCPR